MNVRKLTDPRDWLESERVIATAFLHPWDEGEAREKIKTQTEGRVPRAEESWGLFDDEGVMLTSISTLRRTFAFGGEALPAGEVHMVGSLPERRGGGGVLGRGFSLAAADQRGRNGQGQQHDLGSTGHFDGLQAE